MKDPPLTDTKSPHTNKEKEPSDTKLGKTPEVTAQISLAHQLMDEAKKTVDAKVSRYILLSIRTVQNMLL